MSDDTIWTLQRLNDDDGIPEQMLRTQVLALARACVGDLVVAQRDSGSWDICAYAWTWVGAADSLSTIRRQRQRIARYAAALDARGDYPVTSFTGRALQVFDADEKECRAWAAPRLSTVNNYPAILLPLDGGYSDKLDALHQLPLPQYAWAVIHSEATS